MLISVKALSVIYSSYFVTDYKDTKLYNSVQKSMIVFFNVFIQSNLVLWWRQVRLIDGTKASLDRNWSRCVN